MIHSGSRGLGYQVCDDALASLRNVPKKYGIDLPDRQLACAPVDSPEGRKYIAAMRAAANFAWCNRQLLMHQAREVFDFLRVQTVKELEQFSAQDIFRRLTQPMRNTVDRIRRHLAERNRCLAGDEEFAWECKQGASE